MRFFDPEVMGAAIGEMSAGTEALLQGRRTWKVMAGAWPDRAGDPFADFMNTIPKYVVSDSLSDTEVEAWSPTKIIRPARLVEEVSALRERPGGDISVMGSATVARALLGAGLVDELVLMVEPVILGGGKGIFPADGEQREFRLVSVT
jgi:dihydrofolate reductase